jgi:alpha-L-arabinofuranosidase
MRNGTAIRLALTSPSSVPQFSGTTNPVWAQHVAGPQPYLDASAVYVESDKSIRVAVVNRHLELAMGAVFKFAEEVKGTYDKYEVWAGDVGAMNTVQAPEAVKVVQTSEEWEAGKPIVFKEHSFTLLVFKLK